MNSFLKEGFILYTEIKRGKNSQLLFFSHGTLITKAILKGLVH